MATSDAQKAAVKRYREKVKSIRVEFPPTEYELFDHLAKQENKRTYIKDLIREDMKKSGTP